ncbi:MAG TPA: hypothetical protein VK030_02675 [Actinomycetales bacterium]|nr:hypothetical protein [Actinomycetales bacterium]
MPLHQLHLRVYEPLVAFPPEQRRAWTQYVAAHPPENDELMAQLYEEIVRANAVHNGPRLPKERTPHAYVARHDGQVLICPVQLRFRSIRAAESRPDLFSPTGLAHGAAAALLASLRDERQEVSGPAGRWDVDDGRVRGRIAAWAVPISWLLMFRPEDRLNPSKKRLLMRVSVREVLERLAGVQEELEAMRGGIAPTSSEVGELMSWLGSFHSKSIVELDYGGAVRPLLANGLLLRDEDGYPFDEGPENLARAGKELRAGNFQKSIAEYGNVYRRIRRAQLLQRSS